MIQRVQSIYYALAIICVSIASFGANLYVFQGKEARFDFNAFGVQKYDLSGNLLEIQSFPYYVAGICLSLLLVIVLLAYKNLKRQLTLGRLIIFVYFILLVSLVFGSFLGSYLTKTEELTQGLGLGYFFFIAGFPFVFLGNIGVKRDKTTIDSLNRLR